MARRNTSWVAGHSTVREEIERIRKYFKNNGSSITIKEASAILAERSRRCRVSDTELVSWLRRLRGL